MLSSSPFLGSTFLVPVVGECIFCWKHPYVSLAYGEAEGWEDRGPKSHAQEKGEIRQGLFYFFPVLFRTILRLVVNKIEWGTIFARNRAE